MKGIIVLEGPDSTGKTTLARHLVEKHGAKYVHLTYRWKDSMYRYHMAAARHVARLSKDHLVVLDRSWPSEICYANAYRGGTRWPHLPRAIERVLLTYSSIYVYCLPVDSRKYLDAYDTLKLTRDELFSNILPVVIEYNKLWDKVKDHPHVTRYNYMTDGQDLNSYCDNLVYRVEEFAGQQLDFVDEWDCGVLGHIATANWLFVGCNNSSHFPYPKSDRASMHLSNMLDFAGFPEHECLFAYNVETAKVILEKYEMRTICFDGVLANNLIKAFGYLPASYDPRAKLQSVRAYDNAGRPFSIFAPEYDLMQMERGKHNYSFSAVELAKARTNELVHRRFWCELPKC